MTVGAAYFALPDLASDSVPGARTVDHRADVASLHRSVDMVELQNDRVGFTTIYTRVSLEIVPEPLPILRALPAGPRLRSLLVWRRVSLVVQAHRTPCTLPTVVETNTQCAQAEVEVCLWFLLPAACAGTHA